MISGFVHFANYHKEEIKNLVGAAIFLAGVEEVIENDWKVTAEKISLLLSAAVSRPGVFLITAVTGALFSKGQIERVFGVYSIYANNPYHIYHVASFAAVILAMPSNIKFLYHGCRGKGVKTFAVTLFSRPFLHWSNALLSGLRSARA